MTIEKSFEWLFKRFSSKSIKPCAFDIECLKFIVEWVNREKQKTIKENELFAKLYCHVFIQEIQFYKDMEFAQHSMARILKLPIETHYNLFAKRLNDFELNRYFLSLGIDVEKNIFEDNSSELKKVEKEAFEKFVKGKWSQEQVYKSLNNQITETINLYKNEL